MAGIRAIRAKKNEKRRKVVRKCLKIIEKYHELRNFVTQFRMLELAAPTSRKSGAGHPRRSCAARTAQAAQSQLSGCLHGSKTRQ